MKDKDGWEPGALFPGTVQGDFEVGEVIELLGPEGETFAIARTRLSKTELESLIGTPKMEVAHTDDIVVL